MASDIDQTMNFIQQFSDKALQNARDQANRLAMWTGAPKKVGFEFKESKPNMEKPTKIGDLLTDNEKQNVDVLILNDAAEAWINKFFPNFSGCLKSQPEEWACGILSGSTEFGMNKAAFDASWHEGRDRAYRQASTEQRQLNALFSTRGFGLPPGAHTSAMVSAELRASEAIADINRQQTVKDAEIKLELVKLAATTAVQLKTSMMHMLASFFGQIVELAKHEPGTARMRAKAQAYSAFMSGIANYHNVELGFEKLRLDAAMARAETDGLNSRIDAELAFKGIDSRNHGFGQAASAFAQAAGSAANAASSLQAELYSGQV